MTDARKLQAELKKIQGNSFNDTKELAEFIKSNNISFSTSDLSLWSMFMSIVDSRLSRGGGLYYTPEWLVAVFVELSKEISPKSICDPWATFGFLVGILNETCHPKQAFAFTQNQDEHALGKLIVPKANWQLGEPLQLLDAAANEFDLVASILPMGARSSNGLKLTTASGESIELHDDLGNLVLVSASQHLASHGVGLFVVTQSFFFSQRSVFRQFGVLGLGIEAALALPSGTFAPYTNISAYLIVVRRKLASRMFVAQLSSDAKANLQIIENLRQGKKGGSLELGRFVDPTSFSSLDAIRTAERFSQAERQFGAPAIRLEELAIAINLGRFGDDFVFQQIENADLLKSLPGAPLGIFISDENHEVVGDVEKAIRFFRGAEGVLKLGQIIEKGFFIESEKSLILQLCDLCVYTARRHEETKLGLPVKPIDEGGIPLIEPLVHVGDERLGDVIAWLEAEQKKGRPGK